MRKVMLVLAAVLFAGCVDRREEDAVRAYRTIEECKRLLSFARTPADSVFLGAWVPPTATYHDCRYWLSLAERPS